MAANGNLIFQDTNKATFVGANSNVVIDTVHASLGVGVDVNGPTSNLHVVGNAYVTSNLEVGTANLFVDTVSSRVGVGTTSPGTNLHVMGDIIGRSIFKTRTITKGTSLSGEVDNFAFEADENRILLNNNQGSTSSSRDYTANFITNLPTVLGTIIHLEINSARTNNSTSGVNHRTTIQFNGVDVLSTGNVYLPPSVPAYQRNLKRSIILTTEGWIDYSLYPCVSKSVGDDAVILSATNNSRKASVGVDNPLTEVMRAKLDGFGNPQVGIGKTDPQTTLDVNGTIYGSGSIVQVQHNFGNSSLSYSSSANASNGDIPLTSATGLKLSITPTKTTSKVHVNLNVLAYFNFGNSSYNGVRMQVWRKIGTTYTRVYGRGGSYHDLHWYNSVVTGNPHVFLNISFVDSPNTTLACEYELRAMLYTAPPSGGFLYMGNGGNQPATITLMEIGG